MKDLNIYEREASNHEQRGVSKGTAYDEETDRASENDNNPNGASNDGAMKMDGKLPLAGRPILPTQLSSVRS